MENSPFQFGKLAKKETFVNRESEKKRIASNFQSGINTILISPRRWGKSSLVKEAAETLVSKNRKIQFCFIDMFSIKSEEQFYEIFSSEVIKCSSAKMEEWARNGSELFKQLIPRFSVGVDPQNDFSVSLDWKEVGKHKGEILNLPQILAEKKQIRIVVCIDEFQNIKNFKDSDFLEKSMRSYWQHHHQVSYCLYGSKRHMMSEIFNEKNKPFYRFGDMMMLEKIEKEKWVGFIVNAFQTTQKNISEELAALIAEKMKCHSYYVQQLAHLVWTETEKKATREILQKSLDNLLNWNEIFYQREIEILSQTQINLLEAIINGVEQLTSAKVMKDYNLGTPRNVSKNRQILEKADIIDISGKKISFLDPAFELWFRKVYLKKPI